MTFETLALKKEGAVLTVSLANPPLNLLSLTMIGELMQLAGQLMQDRETRVVVLQSTDPDFFLAHFDLNDIIAVRDDPSKDSRYKDMNGIQSLGLIWQNLPQIKIVKLNGRCRGGGLELILAMDMRFVTDDSLIGFPEAAGGFLPSGGGSTRSIMMAGPARALELVLSARDFTGVEAVEYGLASRSFADRVQLDAYVDPLVAQIASRTWTTIDGVRAVMKRVTAPFVDPLFAGFAAENDGLRAGLDTVEMQEGMRKHLEMGQTRERELDLPASIEASKLAS